MKRRCEYMLVTADEYELPVAIFESVQTIMQYVKVTKDCINKAIREHRKINKKFYIEIINYEYNSKITYYNKNNKAVITA